MAAIALHFPSLSPSLRYSPSAYSPKAHARFSCSSSSQHVISTNFMDFPYVSPSHKDLMVDLVSPSHKDLMVDLASTLDTRLNSFLNPCSLPLDVQSYHNQTGTAHAALHLRSGLHSSPVDFVLGSWLHCELPSGGPLNITTISAYLNSSTDAPNLLVELYQTTPTSMILILDLPPRKDILLNHNYLKTFYEDTQLDRHRQHFQKLAGVTPYVSSSLYIRSIFSPTAVLACIESDRVEEMVRTHVSPIAKEMLKTWLDFGPFGERVVCESEKAYLKMRDGVSKKKTIECELGSSLPRMFGPDIANRVLEALREVF